jgi:two-component system chemotaxis response regulator CheB
MECRRASIKVLVVDDSALMRKMIPLILSSDRDIEVIGTAMDGDFALKKIVDLRPDVVTLDVDMPRMDGLTALKTIVRDFGVPVILVSSLAKEGAGTTLKGLEIGAFDFVPKPREAISVHISEISQELIAKVKAAARCSRPRFKEPMPEKVITGRKNTALHDDCRAEGVVAIGISTGGPQALTEILPLLPHDFPAGILVVQHMPEGFTELFARRLDALCNVEVREATNGETVCPGKILIAPGGRHLKVKRTSFGLISVLSQSPEVSGHRPSATVLFNSVAEEAGDSAVGVIMTGMGEDGVEGLRKIREKGGATIAQNEETSVIYGMPRVAVENGYVDRVVGLDEIVPNLVDIMEMRKRNQRGLCNSTAPALLPGG